MRFLQMAGVGILGFLALGCASVEEKSGSDSGGEGYYRNLRPLWVQAADSEEAPIRSFSRKSYHPANRPTPVLFQGAPPYVLPWGDVLFTREGRILCVNGDTGKERWAAPVETGDWLQVAVYGPRIFIYEKSGRVLICSANGKIMGEREVVSDALLNIDKDQLYLLSSSGIEAFSCLALKTVWKWFPEARLEFLSMITRGDRLAVEYYSSSVHHHETALLDRTDGNIRHRFLGKALGWSGRAFYSLHDWEGEVWGWDDQTGSFLWTKKLNSFDGRSIFLHRGKLIYSSENQYFQPAMTRIGPGGLKQEPRKTETRREIQKENLWRVSLSGRAVLQGDVLFDLHAEGVDGWNVSNGELLYEIRMDDPPQNLAFLKNRLFVLTRGGFLHAFAVRK